MDFQYELANKFPWGELTLQFNVHGGFIHELGVYCDSMDVDIADDICKCLQGVKYDIREMSKKLQYVETKKDESIYGMGSGEMINDTIKWINTIEL